MHIIYTYLGLRKVVIEAMALSAAIKLGTPEPGFFHFGPRLTWISLKQNLCLAPNQKMVGPIKVANNQKINFVS